MADAEAMGAAAAEALGIDGRACPGLLDRDHRHAAADGPDPARRRRSSRRSSRSRAARMRRRASSPPITLAKEAVVSGSTFTFGGMAKGCGMIAPNMATMLAYPHHRRRPAARRRCSASCKDAADRTFNTLNVDGATSTNDTVILLANGRARQGRTRPSSPMRCTSSVRGTDLQMAQGRRGHDQDGDAHASPARRAMPRRAAPPRTSPRTISSNAPGTAATLIGAGCSARRARPGSAFDPDKSASLMAGSPSRAAAPTSPMTTRRSPRT